MHRLHRCFFEIILRSALCKRLSEEISDIDIFRCIENHLGHIRKLRCIDITGFQVFFHIVQGDEPFIQPSQLDAVKACFEDVTTQIATLVKPFTADEPFAVLENVNSPKVVVNTNWNALYFSRSIIPYQRNAEKQDWLKGHTYYKHIGLYAYRTDVLKEITMLPQSSLELAESLEQLRWLENGYKIKVGISEVEIAFSLHKVTAKQFL